MTLSVCFDALGTAFSVDPLVQAVEECLGKELKERGASARGLVMDWFHSAQRDYTYLSVVSPPPPPISQILTLTLPRTLSFALADHSPSLSASPTSTDLSPVLATLKKLSASPGLADGLKLLKDAGAKVYIVTNGGEEATRGYVELAGVEKLVDGVQSCDEVGVGKPLAQVYVAANALCGKAEGNAEGKKERWFVAAHLWDLAAARKAGFKTGYVLSEQPPVDDVAGWWDMWGGKPDVIGGNIADVARGILSAVG